MAGAGTDATHTSVLAAWTNLVLKRKDT